MSSLNGTHRGIPGDLKSGGEHQNGLQLFLEAILRRVAKQAKDLQNFEKAELQQFMLFPTKSRESRESQYPKKETKLESKKRIVAKNEKENPDSKTPKPDRGKEYSKGTYNACGRKALKWKKCRVRLRGDPDVNPHANIL